MVVVIDDPYSLLGVSPGASPADVKRAFRKLARVMHPDVSDDPDHTELFKRIIVAYEAVLDGTVFLPGSSGEPDRERGKVDFDNVDAELHHLVMRCKEAAARLRESAAQARAAEEEWAALADDMAAEIIDQAVGAFVYSVQERSSYQFQAPDDARLRSRPRLFDDSRRFLDGAQHALAEPDQRLEANLARGALGAVGLSRVAGAVGRGAAPVDKELFARAVMSAIARSLLEVGLLGAGELSSGESAPLALMEATNAVAVAALEGRHE
jgi:curved DNA-binding protein CbpA